MFLHKIALISIKYLPGIISIIYLLNSIFSYFGISLIILSYLCYTSLLPWLTILMFSFVFKFCIWHRLPLYYIMVCNILNVCTIIYNIYPITLMFISVLLFGIFCILGAYLKNKYNEQNKINKRNFTTNN